MSKYHCICNGLMRKQRTYPRPRKIGDYIGNKSLIEAVCDDRRIPALRPTRSARSPAAAGQRRASPAPGPRAGFATPPRLPPRRPSRCRSANCRPSTRRSSYVALRAAKRDVSLACCVRREPQRGRPRVRPRPHHGGARLPADRGPARRSGGRCRAGFARRRMPRAAPSACRAGARHECTRQDSAAARAGRRRRPRFAPSHLDLARRENRRMRER